MQRGEHPENAGDSPAQILHQQAANAGGEEAENGGGGGRPVAQNVLASMVRQSLFLTILGQTPLQMPRGIQNLVRQYSETEDGGGGRGSPANPPPPPQGRRQRMADLEQGRVLSSARQQQSVPIAGHHRHQSQEEERGSSSEGSEGGRREWHGANATQDDGIGRRNKTASFPVVPMDYQRTPSEEQTDGIPFEEEPIHDGTEAMDGHRRTADEGEDEMEDADGADFCAELWRTLQINKFPCIIFMASVLCNLLVSVTALVYFLVNNVTLVTFLSFIFTITFTYDAKKFKKVVTGKSSRFWLIFCAVRIAFRQFMVQFVFGQHIYTLPTLIFAETSTANGENARSYWSTCYILAISTIFILDCALSLKILVFIMPKCMNAAKGRLYQWIEYTSFLYTFAIPFIHWNAYMATFWFTLVYGGAKLLFGLCLLVCWLLTTFNLILFLFRGKPKLGSTPTKAECKKQEQCTICCQEDFNEPVKLECSHIFCFECIEKWLEKKKTCPFCRTAVVDKLEDTNYRDGDFMMGMLCA